MGVCYVLGAEMNTQMNTQIVITLAGGLHEIEKRAFSAFLHHKLQHYTILSVDYQDQCISSDRCFKVVQDHGFRKEYWITEYSDGSHKYHNKTFRAKWVPA